VASFSLAHLARPAFFIPIMNRQTLLVLATLALTACGPANLPSDYDSSNPQGTFGRPQNISDMASRIRNGDIPPEAIVTTIYFGFDKYTVEASERSKLDAIAGAIKGKTLLLPGYTDHVGTEEYNVGLSDRRAQSVAEYLVRLGSSKSQMEVVALGESQAAQGASSATAAKDRKVIVVDANYKGAAPSASTGNASSINGSAGPAPAPVGIN
jgi:outer membrane protein OmpA-like peptidoglycan-associated protein